MNKYVGMGSYYRGILNGEKIEAISEDQLLRLASRKANRDFNPRDVLYVDYIHVDDDGAETDPLPQSCFVRLCGGSWNFKGYNTDGKVAVA